MGSKVEARGRHRAGRGWTLRSREANNRAQPSSQSQVACLRFLACVCRLWTRVRVLERDTDTRETKAAGNIAQTDRGSAVIASLMGFWAEFKAFESHVATARQSSGFFLLVHTLTGRAYLALQYLIHPAALPNFGLVPLSSSTIGHRLPRDTALQSDCQTSLQRAVYSLLWKLHRSRPSTRVIHHSLKA